MQAIKLLQLSNLDLSAYVDAELERNPLLERAEEPDFAAPTDAASGEPEPPPPRLRRPARRRLAGGAARLARGDRGAARHRPRQRVPGRRAGRAGRTARPSRSAIRSGPRSAPAAAATRTATSTPTSPRVEPRSPTTSPSSSRWPSRDPARRLIGQYLIDLVDEAGYLAADLAEVGGQARRAARRRSRACWQVIQTFEPAGVGARDLAECLALQLKDRDRFDPAMAALVGQSRPARQARLRRAEEALRRRRRGPRRHGGRAPRLDPKPGLRLRRRPGDSRSCRTCSCGRRPTAAGRSSSTPTPCRACWSTRAISAAVAPAAKDAKDKTFLADCLQTANWLTREPRPARQDHPQGGDRDRPPAGRASSPTASSTCGRSMLKTVADAIGMHESTVSRVTSNKYMATPRGIFEMKYFFTSAIAAAGGGDAHSAEAVRHRIKQMIDAESAGRRAVRRHHRQAAARGGHRHRPAHRRQVSRGHAHSLLRPAPAREAGAAAASA